MSVRMVSEVLRHHVRYEVWVGDRVAWRRYVRIGRDAKQREAAAREQERVAMEVATAPDPTQFAESNAGRHALEPVPLGVCRECGCEVGESHSPACPFGGEPR